MIGVRGWIKTIYIITCILFSQLKINENQKMILYLNNLKIDNFVQVSFQQRIGAKFSRMSRAVIMA